MIKSVEPSFSGLYKVDLRELKTERQFFYYAKSGFFALNKQAVHEPLINKDLDKIVIMTIPDRFNCLVETYLKKGRVKFDKMA